MDISSRIRKIEVGLIFLAAILVAVFLLGLWAHVFAGNWHRVSVQDDLPNALILATLVTSLAIVLRSLPKGKARMYLAIGLMLIIFEVFLELPLKKYVALVPATPIRSWFFLFGMTEFIGMIFTLVGITALFRELKRKS